MYPVSFPSPLFAKNPEFKGRSITLSTATESPHVFLRDTRTIGNESRMLRRVLELVYVCTYKQLAECICDVHVPPFLEISSFETLFVKASSENSNNIFPEKAENVRRLIGAYFSTSGGGKFFL